MPLTTPPSDSTLQTSDITTNNVSTTKHGFTPKATNVGNFLKDDGNWTAIPGGGDALVANPLSQFAATTSLQLKNTISDETGSGLLVFATSPTLTTPVIGDFSTSTHTHADAAGGGLLTFAGVGAGTVVQGVSTTNGAVATGSTVIPQDDTIPQITEGIEFMTLAITPKATTHRLIIMWGCYLSNSVTTHLITALFQDATANALAASAQFGGTATGMQYVTGSHEMAAGTTSSTTFRIRGGGSDAGTTTFNGAAGARRFGAITKSFIHIFEVKA